MIGRSEIRGLLAEAGVRPSKHRGQNFLADPGVVHKIVRLAGVGPGDAVLEVGVGLGSLTVGLIAAGADVFGVEIDPALAGVAAAMVEREAAAAGADDPAPGALTLHLADATTCDWPALLPSGVTVMVANLPYSVGTRILLDVLATAPQVQTFVVMVQREVGERLVAGPGDAAYGAASVKVAWAAAASLAGRVAPSVFVPQPEVDSVLVRLDRRDPPVGADPAWVLGAVDAGFAQRRKTLRRALAARWPDAAVAVALDESGIDGTRRAETLGLAEFCALGTALASANANPA